MTEEYPQELRGLLERIAPGWPELLEIGVGWYPLLAKLDATLSVIAPNYVVQQVKSKFGALSFYADSSDDPSHFDQAFTDAVRAAEWESTETCEVCGAPARQYVIRMWVSTLCHPHAIEAREDAVDTDLPPSAA
ncbi:hypothetical protein QYR02_09500 [Microbacterium maritypicum]|uniref:hypothetical protein n=1 Tax=Microbacterium maritypicum TaxID=33918 RepID=UPI0026721F6E|nr:hypothetical protein [Microbacterium liquefaciens]WKT87697.1 hypothetical protein QYR02_09500 [Microbacterium liquefaciens]